MAEYRAEASVFQSTRSPKALGAQQLDQERHRPPPGVPAVLVPKTSRSKLREGLKACRKTFPGLLLGSLH